MSAVEIEDAVVSASAPEPSGSTGPTSGAIKRTVSRLLTGRDLTSLSLKSLRKEIEERLGVAEGSLTARKEEVKLAAQAFMTQQKPPNAAEEPQASGTEHMVAQVASIAESSRVIAQDVQMDSSKKRPAEDPQTDSKKKKKQQITGSRVFQKEHWAAVTNELMEQNGGIKPSMGAVLSAVSTRFKNLPQEEQEKYESRAKEANAAAVGEDVTAGKTSAPKKPKSSGKGTGKGRKKTDAEPTLTRADFQQFSKPLQGKVSNVIGQEVFQATLLPRSFQSGTVGWFHNRKVAVHLEGGHVVNCSAQISLYCDGSKNWNDGEGFCADAFPKPAAAPDAAASLGEASAAKDAGIDDSVTESVAPDPVAADTAIDTSVAEDPVAPDTAITS